MRKLKVDTPRFINSIIARRERPHTDVERHEPEENICLELYPLDGLLNRAEAAQVLGLQPSALASMAVKGTGPKMIKIGRLSKYLYADLVSYVESRTVNSTATFGRKA